MPDSGFIVNDAEVAGITSAFAVGDVILLHADATADAKSRALPQSCFLSHVEIQMDQTALTTASIQAFITYDAVGDDPLTARTDSINVHAGLTDTSLRNCAISFEGVHFTAPSGQTTAGKLYLWLKTDAGTVTLKKARLHWYTGARG